LGRALQITTYQIQLANALKDVVSFMDQDLLFSKASVRAVLTEMAGVSISGSQRIFFLGGTVKNGQIDLN